MFYRKLISKQKIIIFDGVPGGGKDLLGVILTGIPKIDQYDLKPHVDQIAALYSIKKIDLNTAVYFLRTNHNLFFYDSLMLRKTNFRESDLTSIKKHPRFKEFKKRMDINDKKVFRRFKKKIISLYCTHLTANFSKPYFAAFKKKLIFIKLLRSPLNLEMVKHIAKWTVKWEKSDCRDGYIKFYDKSSKKSYPIFFKKNYKEFLKANKYERAILMLESYSKNNFNLKKYQKEYGSKAMIVPFENLLSNPLKYSKIISKKIKSNLDNIFFQNLKKNNVPRKIDLINDNKLAINFLKKKVSNKYFKKIIELNDYYSKVILRNY